MGTIAHAKAEPRVGGVMIVNVQENKVNPVFIFQVEPMHDRLISLSGGSPVGVAVEKLGASRLADECIVFCKRFRRRA